MLEPDVAIWDVRRSALSKPDNWRCPIEDAQVSLKRLYPALEDGQGRRLFVLRLLPAAGTI